MKYPMAISVCIALAISPSFAQNPYSEGVYQRGKDGFHMNLCHLVGVREIDREKDWDYKACGYTCYKRGTEEKEGRFVGIFVAKRDSCPRYMEMGLGDWNKVEK